MPTYEARGKVWVLSSAVQVLLNRIKAPIEYNDDVVSKALILLAEKKLTRRQKEVLLKIYEIGSYKSMTGLARKIAKELDIPLSTAKWYLKEFRDMMLLRGGTAEEKGVRCTLTPAGIMIAKYLKKLM